MNRTQKEQVVASAREEFLESAGSFVVGYRGVTVHDLQLLRNKLRNNGGVFRVVKKRLASIAVDGVEGVNSLDSYLNGQIGIVFAKEDPVVVAKTLYDFSRENNNLSVIAGCLDGQVFDKKEVKRIASLPSKDVLLAQLVGLLNAPITRFVSVLTDILAKPVRVIKSIEEKKRNEV